MYGYTEHNLIKIDQMDPRPDYLALVHTFKFWDQYADAISDLFHKNKMQEAQMLRNILLQKIRDKKVYMRFPK